MKKISGKQQGARMTLRLPSSLQEALKITAAAEGLPLNTYCLYILSRHDIYKANKPIKRINKLK